MASRYRHEPLAATASVFGERILSDALMQQESNKKIRQGLWLGQLDDIYATVLRQAYFVRFERTAHQMIAEGATGDQLAQTYLRELRQQFGKAVRVPDEFQWEWLTIPHIYASPFYCYAYSFGNLLVLALTGGTSKKDGLLSRSIWICSPPEARRHRKEFLPTSM